MADVTRTLGEHMVRLTQTMQDRQNTTTSAGDGSEIMEEFNKLDFYMSLPSPWNVLPRRTGKVGDERNLIKQYLSSQSGSAKIEPFNGDEARYFSWRPNVIQIIHKANLPVSDKYMQLKLCFKENVDATLDVYIENKDATKEAYANLIGFIEDTWGGKDRAYLWAETKLLAVKRLNTSALESISCVRAEIQRFIRFCRDNDLAERLSQTPTVGKILRKLLPQTAINEMQIHRKCGNLRQDPKTLYLVEEYLGMLAEATSATNLLLGVQRKPSSFGADRHRGGRFGGDIRHGYVGAADRDVGRQPDTVSDGEPDIEPDVYELTEEDVDEITGEVYVHMANGAKMVRYPECLLCKTKGAKPKFPRHFLFSCDEFKNMAMANKLDYLKKNNRCFNCLAPTHSSQDCKSGRRCQKCSKKHHTLICKEEGEKK